MGLAMLREIMRLNELVTNTSSRASSLSVDHDITVISVYTFIGVYN